MGQKQNSCVPGVILKLIVGIGNPTSYYQHTRHNVGKTFVDYLADINKVQFQKIQGGHIAYIKKGNGFIALFNSNSYMNLSGGPTKQAIQYCNLGIENLIVVHDDLDNQIGKCKVKEGGSAEGQNGIRSIIQHLSGNPNFLRLKIGISRPQSKESHIVSQWVLGNFGSDEVKILEEESFPKCIELLNKRGFL